MIAMKLDEQHVTPYTSLNLSRRYAKKCLSKREEY
jgi:hypothetical protein